MMTIEERRSVAQIKKASEDFVSAVNKLIRLESMKEANRKEPGKYSEDDFLKLLGNDTN